MELLLRECRRRSHHSAGGPGCDSLMLAERRNAPRARVRATRAHCLRPDGEITFQTSPVTFNWHVPAALARSRCTVLAAWRRNTVPTEPSSVQLARLGGSAWSACVHSAPRRVPRLVMPRRRWLQYLGKPVKTVKTVKTVVKTGCRTGENRENRVMSSKERR